MDIFNTFATNADLEEAGVEVKIGPEAYITVARAGNRKYSKLLGTLFEENKQLLETGTIEADDYSDTLMIEVIAETILLGWRGLEYQGKKMKYSVDNAKLMLGHRDFRQLVNDHSRKIEHFKSGVETTVLKN